LLVVIFAASMVGLSYAAPSMSISVPARTWVSAGFVLLGVIVAGAAVLAFYHHKTTVNPLTPEQTSALVASGIYRLSRNPMYLGFLLALVGWGIYLANVAALLLLPLFVLYVNRYQIEPEERALLAKFGEPFAEYLAAVRRWV
jgi:protein-S-isoprenylcysteine O-methyltransferase Ste14